MSLKFFIKTILIALFVSIVIAEEDSLKGECKEIYDFFDFRNNTGSLSGCEVDSNGKVISIKLNSYEILEECVKKALSYNTITKLSYNKVGATPYHDPVYKSFPPEIANLTSLEEFDFTFIGFQYYAKTGIPSGNLKLSKTLKKLSISGITASQDNIDDISTLTNLEHLDLRYFNIPSQSFNVDSLKSLDKLSFLELRNDGYVRFDTMPEVIYSSADTLEHLVIVGHGIAEITDKFSTLKKLNHLVLRGCELSNILDYVKDLKNLEYLDVSSNNIDAELPESLNELKKLKYIDLSRNTNITGKALTNSNLETCVYEKTYELCMPNSNIKCLQDDNNYGFSECEKPLGFSTDGQCGSDHGMCTEGYCCSRFGWCGSTPLHCNISEGCQSKYGKCDVPSTTTTDNDTTTTSSPSPSSTSDVYTDTGRCGPNLGKCRPGQCCSKYGWCGTGTNYCDAGCQKEFGSCN